MATQKKIETVTKLTDSVNRSKSIIFVDYRTIKHKQLETLRKTLKKTQSEFVVAKNRLMLRALGDRAESVSAYLSNTTATLFNFGDEVGGLKDLMKFFKTIGAGILKGGILGQTVLTDAQVSILAGLPGRQELLGQLAGQLKAPLYHLHYALSWNMSKLVWGLNAIKNKKS